MYLLVLDTHLVRKEGKFKRVGTFQQSEIYVWRETQSTNKTKRSLQSSQRNWNKWVPFWDRLVKLMSLIQKIISHYKSGNQYPSKLNNLTKAINLLSVRTHIKTHLQTPRSVPLLFPALFFPLFMTSWGHNLKKKHMWQGESRNCWGKISP